MQQEIPNKQRGESPNFESTYIEYKEYLTSKLTNWRELYINSKREIDSIYLQVQKREAAAELMTRVLFKLASSESPLFVRGQLFTFDLNKLFPDNIPTELIKKFLQLVKDRELKTYNEISFESRLMSSEAIKDEFIKNPSLFGNIVKNYNKKELEQALDYLYVFTMADVCSFTGEIDLLENTGVGEFIAKRFILNVNRILEEDVFSEDEHFQEAFMSIATAIKLYKNDRAISILTKPEEIKTANPKMVELRKKYREQFGLSIPSEEEINSRIAESSQITTNQSDKIVDTMLLSLYEYDRKNELRLSKEYQAAAKQIRAQFKNILEGKLECPNTYSSFEILLIDILSRVQIARDEAILKLNQIHQKFFQDQESIDLREDRIMTLYQTLLEQGKPWEVANLEESQAILSKWAEKFAVEMPWQRLAIDDNGIFSGFCSDLIARQRFIGSEAI